MSKKKLKNIDELQATLTKYLDTAIGEGLASVEEWNDPGWAMEQCFYEFERNHSQSTPIPAWLYQSLQNRAHRAAKLANPKFQFQIINSPEEDIVRRVLNALDYK